MSPASTPAPTSAPRALRHRRSARRLTAGQLADLRQAFEAAQGINDDRGYQARAGIHGLPLPISCVHHRELFLPWYRAYLYFLEKALQERVPGVTLLWWNWTADHAEGIPEAYVRQRVSGRKNPLFDSPIQSSGRERPSQRRTTRAPGPPGELPTAAQLGAGLSQPALFPLHTPLGRISHRGHLWARRAVGRNPPPPP